MTDDAVVRLSGFAGDVATDGSLTLAGTYSDWVRLLAVLDDDAEFTLEVAELPMTPTTRAVAEVAFVPLQSTRTDDDRASDAEPGGAATFDGVRATVFGFDRFDSFRKQLSEILQYNDADELALQGWHAHFELDQTTTLDSAPPGARLTEIMLAGPNPE